MPITVPVIREQYFRIPAQRFKQGHRTVFAFALNLEQLDSMLPERVDEDVVRDANRRLTPSHAKQIEAYLRDHDDWVLGAILLGIDPDAVEFTAFEDEEGNPSPAFGELRISYNQMSAIRLFDGQHRRRAIQDVLAGLRDSERDREHLLSQSGSSGVDSDSASELTRQLGELRAKRRSLLKQSVPIVLYEEGDIRALRQMFADAAKTKPIEAVTRARFDDRDPFNRASYEVAEQSELFRGRIEMERNTVARTSRNLLSFNQLSTVLKTLMFGYYGRVSQVRSLELDADYGPVVKLGVEWADNFLPATCTEYEQLLNREIEDDLLVPSLRSETFALNATVLRVLAACFHGWQEEVGPDLSLLAHFFRAHSFNNTLKNSLLVQAGLVTPGATSPVARRQEVQKSIRYILRNAKRSSDNRRS